MTTRLPIAGSPAELRSKISGEVLTSEDHKYHVMRLAWNRAYEHRPSMIVMPTSAADVSIAVRHAVATNQHVAVQATGHGVAVAANGAMLILTHNLDSVVVDSEAWTARIGAGVKWGQVLGPATAAGLAPLLGSTPDVSAIGYTLGGGMGWLARKFGLSADHVRSIEVVTADGEIRLASPEAEQDLFWALRGGGAGSLGLVTAFEIDLVPVPSFYAGNLLYPGSLAREIATRYREWLREVPEELTSSIVFMNFPPFDDVPEPLRGRSFTIIRGAFVGSDEDGSDLLAYWRDWREPEIDMWGRLPFSEVASISNDPVDPMPGMASTAWLDDLSDDAADVIVRALFEQDGPSPLVFAEVRHAGGAIAREPEHPNAFGNRHLLHLLEVVGVAGPDSLPDLEEFIAALHASLTPHVAAGAYLNFLEGDEKRRRTREGFDGDSWLRLRQIKANIDPRNVFSHGIAIS